MDLVLQLLFALALLNVLFQISQWKTPGFLLVAFAIGLIAYLLYPWTVAQSKEQLNTWMQNPIIMQNLAVIQVMESLLFIGIDLSILKKHFGQPVNRYLKYASYFPGLFWISAVLHTQMVSFYFFSGIDFETLAIYFSLGLTACFIAVPIIIKYILPEHYLRMELRYILSFGQILGSIIITIFCQGLPYKPQQNNYDLTSFLIVLASAILMVFLGWIWSLIGKQIKINGNTK